jgi:hypothetical protein
LTDFVEREPSPHGEVPLEFDWIDGEVIVSAAGPDQPVPVGSRVVGFAGVAIDSFMLDARLHTSAASSNAASQRALDSLRHGPLGEALVIKYFSVEDPYTNSYASIEYAEPRAVERAVTKTLTSDILYVDLTLVSDANVDEIIASAGQASGVIFDARGALQELSIASIVSHLIDEPLEAAPRLLPLITRPYLKDVDFRSLTTTIQPAGPRLTGRCVFLVDGRTIQDGEVLLSFVQAGSLGVILGSPMAGARGETAVLDLGTGYDLRFTSTKSTQLDGSRYHGIGIEPQVEVVRTQAVLASGRDDLIEQALAALGS